MKNRMAGRAKKFFRERQEIRRPRASCHHDGVATDPMPIFQNNPGDAVVVFVQPTECCSLAQIHTARSRIFDEGCDNASAFDVAGLRIKETVMKAVFRKGWKTLMEREVIERFDWVPEFFQHARAFEFKIARLHFLLTHKQNAGFVIKLDPEFRVPFSPDRNAT